MGSSPSQTPNTAAAKFLSAMGATLRPYDLLGRYGERDFLVLLPGCDAAGARAVAQRLGGAITSKPAAPGAVAVGCRVAVAVTSPEAPRDREGLLAAAEAALGHAGQGSRPPAAPDAPPPSPSAAPKSTRRRAR